MTRFAPRGLSFRREADSPMHCRCANLYVIDFPAEGETSQNAANRSEQDLFGRPLENGRPPCWVDNSLLLPLTVFTHN